MSNISNRIRNIAYKHLYKIFLIQNIFLLFSVYHFFYWLEFISETHPSESLYANGLATSFFEVHSIIELIILAIFSLFAIWSVDSLCKYIHIKLIYKNHIYYKITYLVLSIVFLLFIIYMLFAFFEFVSNKINIVYVDVWPNYFKVDYYNGIKRKIVSCLLCIYIVAFVAVFICYIKNVLSNKERNFYKNSSVANRLSFFIIYFSLIFLFGLLGLAEYQIRTEGGKTFSSKYYYNIAGLGAYSGRYKKDPLGVGDGVHLGRYNGKIFVINVKNKLFYSCNYDKFKQMSCAFYSPYGENYPGT